MASWRSFLTGLFVCLFALTAVGQTYGKVSKFEKIRSFPFTSKTSGNYCGVVAMRPDLGNYGAKSCNGGNKSGQECTVDGDCPGSTCSASVNKCFPFPDATRIGKAQALWWSAEGWIPTTLTKNSAITANGTSLVYDRDTTIPTPQDSAACKTGADMYNETNATLNSPAGCFDYSSFRRCAGGSNGGKSCTTDSECPSSACNTWSFYCQQDYNTSWFDNTFDKDVYTSTHSGKVLAAQINWVNQQAAIQRPGGTAPWHVLAIRWDLLMPWEMQDAGFDPSWLLTAGTPEHASPGATPWLDFSNWLTGDTSAVCATTNAQCTATAVGKLKMRNDCCVDANGGTYGWENFCTSQCSFSYSHNGWNKAFYHDAQATWKPGWDMRDFGFRYNDLITTAGGDPTAKIYYLTRPSASHWSPNGVMVDQNNQAYVTWRTGMVQKLLAETGADYIHLNHKLAQYFNSFHTWSWYVRDLVDKYDGACHICVGGTESGNVCNSSAEISACTGGGGTCPSNITASTCTGGGGTCTNSICVGGTSAGKTCTDGVVQTSEVVCVGDGGFSANQDSGGYKASDYVAGLRKIATTLHANNIKYQVTFNAGLWLGTKYCRYTSTGSNPMKKASLVDTTTSSDACTSDGDCTAAAGGKCTQAYDDPRTAGVDENDTLRSIVYDADLLFIDANTPGMFGGSNQSGTGCSGGETGAALTECQATCKGKTGDYLATCVRKAAGKPTLYIGAGDATSANCY